MLTAAAAGLALAAATHLGMVFLSVAPPNTVSARHAKAVDDWVHPEFEQNWRLFAPDPLQQNIDVSARVAIRTVGGTWVTGWTDLSAQDAVVIRHNPVPSHTQQNELRRAWDMYTSAHDPQDHATSPTGRLVEQYLGRIVIHRLAPHADAGTLAGVQLRSVTTTVPPPSFSAGPGAPAPPAVRTLPWWPLTPSAFTDAEATP